MAGSNTELGKVSNKSAFIVALLLLLMAVSVLYTAYSYSGGSGIFPRFIGWVFVGLVLLEIAVQLKGLFKPLAPISADSQAPADNVIVLKEIRGFLWIGLFLLVLYLVGFLISIPLYLFAFLRFSANRSLKESLIMSVSSTLFVYVLFIQVMEYRLYSGVLLGG